MLNANFEFVPVSALLTKLQGCIGLKISRNEVQILCCPFGLQVHLRKAISFVFANRSIIDFNERPANSIPEREYVLESRVKKYEAFNPTKDSILFEINGDKAHPAEALEKVRSKDAWYTQFGRLIRESEAPIKVVNLAKQKSEGAQRLQPLYGEWQIYLVESPLLIDGKIPKNSFGNIDLYRQNMLPEGCVYIPDDDAWKVAKRLDIDYAAACIGFKFSGRQAVPKIEGIVITKKDRSVFEEHYKEIVQAEEKLEIQNLWNKVDSGFGRLVKAARTFYQFRGRDMKIDTPEIVSSKSEKDNPVKMQDDFDAL